MDVYIRVPSLGKIELRNYSTEGKQVIHEELLDLHSNTWNNLSENKTLTVE